VLSPERVQATSMSGPAVAVARAMKDITERYACAPRLTSFCPEGTWSYGAATVFLPATR
jgi:hypothetical protein